MSNIEQKLQAVEKTQAAILETLKSLDQPNYRVVGGDGGVAVSYIEEGGPQDVVRIDNLWSRGENTMKNFRKNSYLPGYKGAKEGGFKSFGDFLLTGLRDSKSAEWQNRHASCYKAVQGMSVGAAEDGGYMVQPEYSDRMLERVYNNKIFSMTDNYTVAGNNLVFMRNAETSRANGSRKGGIRGYWLGEGQTGTKSAPKMRQVQLRLKKLCILVYLTEELISDGGTAVQSYVEKCAAEEFNFLIGDAIFNGTGVGQPLGILNSGSLVNITKESGQAASTIVAANIDKMWARRYAAADGYSWFHNQDCGPQLDSLSQAIGTAGIALYRPSNGLAGNAPQLLKTAPRVETEFNSTVGTVGDILLADLSQVLSITKGGVSQMASTHVEFLTDQTALKFTMRLDARPWDDTPLTPYKGSNTQSSFVALETRA
jgi:HK97 family phage major capsid protein